MKIGIDLGTTFSCIGYVNHEGQTKLAKDSLTNDQATPSVIYLKNNSCLVGQLAINKLDLDSNAQLCWFFKRELGTGEILFVDQNKFGWTAEALSAMLLKKLIHDVEFQSNKKVKGATITVPVHFDSRQRNGVVQSAKLAGIDDVEILDEPVAAALHYGFTVKDKEQIILVYDLGGGTFDVTLLHISGNNFQTLGSLGKNDIGGKEIDGIVMDLIIDGLKKKNVEVDWNNYNMQLLRKYAEKSKIEMCTDGKDQNLSLIFSNWNGTLTISFSAFTEKVTAFFDKTFEITKSCLCHANVNLDQIDYHLFVGGSTQVFFLKKNYSKYFNIAEEKVRSHHPNTAVCYGAIIHANRDEISYDQNENISELKGMTGFNIAVVIQDLEKGESLDTLIAKNNPLPCSAKRTYFKSTQEQQFLEINLVSFIEDRKNIRELTQIKIGPIFSDAINYALEVELKLASDGTLTIFVIDLQTGKEVLKRVNYLDKEESLLLQQKINLDKMIINQITT